MKELELLKKKLNREILARKQAEQILEAKALELFQANEQLVKLNENLEDQIRQRTEDLLIARERAEKAQKAEQVFLANMSHEIRTPLNAIIGMSYLLKDGELYGRQREYLDIVVNSAGILKGLVSDILDMSKIDSGEAEMNVSNFDLGIFGSTLLNAFSVSAKENALVLSSNIIEENKYIVHSDKQWLNQILINLLSNAIKFTSTGEVKLTINATELSDEFDTFYFEVSDTGIGMNQEEKEKVFSEFKQANNEISKKYGGTGLGLSISSRLTALLGGELQVESEKGKGSKFFFSLKLKKASKEEFDSAKDLKVFNELKLKKLNVLVVEDNSMNQEYISILLNKWQIPFDIADNGAIAVEKYKSNEFDLVFMDISMPVMDGFEATTLIRQMDKKQVPIIALTASNILSKKEMALESGMTEFLAKPFTPEELSSVLQKFASFDHVEGDDADVSFQFSEKLDAKNLKKLYGADFDYAHDMFSTYLNLVDDELLVLTKHAESSDFENVRKQTHKIKPIFSLVGLTHISDTCEKIEAQIKESDLTNINEMIEELSSEIMNTKPLIEQEALTLKTTLADKL